MARRFLLDIPAQDAGFQLDDAGERTLKLRYRDADGATILEEDAPEPPTIRFEHSDGSGGMRWSKAVLPLDLEEDVPPGTAAVELLADGAVIARADVAAFAMDSLPPPQASQAVRGESGWHLRVISERFSNAERFFGACRDLASAMERARPFDRPGLRWRITAHFWPSFGPGGLFRTFDPPFGDRRVFGQDQPLAKAFLDSLGARDMGLVLVDSPSRGGAGGAGAVWPAWSTIVSEPGETWQDVTLHELGHAFGLADEYQDASNTVPAPATLEQNVSKSFGALPSPWAAMINVAVPPPTSANPPPASGWPADAVGTFQGARYSDDLFRSSPQCRMRVATNDFCPVCCELIAARLR